MHVSFLYGFALLLWGRPPAFSPLNPLQLWSLSFRPRNKTRVVGLQMLQTRDTIFSFAYFLGILKLNITR